MNKKWVGTDVKRKQDARLLTGQGTYVDDVQLPGMLYCSYLRSPYAHARIKKIDTSKAVKLPGVVTVLTGEDIKGYPLPTCIDQPGQKSVDGLVFPMAVNKVRWAGEPVAAVAAVDRYISEDALELIDVEYEPLPVVVDIEKAMEKNAPLLYEELGDNILVRIPATFGDIDKAFNEADHIISERLYEQRYSGFPLEARCTIANYKSADKKLEIWTSTQGPFQARSYISRVLNIPEQNIRVIVPDVGGAFGNKWVWGDDIVPCLFSIMTGKPVKWTENRMEAFMASPHSRDYIYDVQVACKNDGKILGVKSNMIANYGAEAANRGPGAGPVVAAGFSLLGPYKVNALSIDHIGVLTNKSFYGAYRGYGKDMANRVLERMINIMSRELAIPPEEIRRKNYIQPNEYPYRQLSGSLYDSGNLPELQRRTLEMMDYDNLKKDKERLRKEGKYIGIGIAAKVEPSGGIPTNAFYAGYEGVSVKITSEGGIILAHGLVDIGQGTESTLTQVVADELGVTPDDIRAIIGDTDMTPCGAGPFSSRGASWTTSCTVNACQKLREKLLKVGANLLKVKLEEVDIANGKVYLKKTPSKSLTIRDIARAAHYFPGVYAAYPADMLAEDASLEVTTYYTAPQPPVSWVPPICFYTTHATAFEGAIVEVDPDTGILKIKKYFTTHDCGKVINHMIVDGQIHGGTLQGIAGAMYEELQYDENGQLLTTTFMDYLMPTAAEAVDIQIDRIETPSPFTPLGTKGAGEGAICATPSVIVNAVEDALGVTVKRTPLTPERVLSLVKEAKQKKTI